MKKMATTGIELWSKRRQSDARTIQTTECHFVPKIRQLHNIIKDQKEKKRKCVVVSVQ
jgi:hypothetical protein